MSQLQNTQFVSSVSFSERVCRFMIVLISNHLCHHFPLRSLFKTPDKYKRLEHISPDQADLHWLPVLFPFGFKMFLVTFKALNGL